jgi:hypothetical protein
MSEEIISTINYNESNPTYQKIKREFTNKLKDKYQCEDYDKIVDYVFDFVFKNKMTKAECIQKLDSVFNNKADLMMDYLWKITKEAEHAPEEIDSDDNNYNNRKQGKNQWKRNSKKFRNEGKYSKNKRDRSRSYSKERSNSKFDYNYPPMVPKGFYPPQRGRYGGSMMPMGGAYPPPYMMGQMMTR